MFKKALFTCLLFAFPFLTNAQNLSQCFADSAFVFDNYSGQDSTLRFKIFYEVDYNTKTVIERWLKKSNASNTYKLNKKNTTRYNDQDREIYTENLTYAANGVNLSTGQRVLKSYHESSELIDSITTVNWDSPSGLWQNAYSFATSYNFNDEIIQVKFFYWDYSISTAV
jgi:hypothetical protein